MKDIKELTNIEEIKAISDPYRMQIISCFRKLDRPATVKNIADEMGEVPAKVHYHIKKLEKVGILKLIYTENIKGIIAKYYEVTARSFSIKHEDKEIENSVSQVFLGETEKFVHNTFNNSKDIFLGEIRKGKGSDNEIEGRIVTNTIYLTEEEAKKLKEYIVDFMNGHSKKSELNNKKEYHFFSSIINITSKNNK